VPGAKQHALEIPFTLRGVSGLIEVSITENVDPGSIGYQLLTGPLADAARGFPICRANVRYAADGYAAVFGWTQMVRSTDATNEFETDPIAIYDDVSTPYAWFGLKPEAFDAPSRDSRYDMDWDTHSFLCVSPDAVLTRRVEAVAGFSWGFTVSQSKIRFAPPAVLDAGHWNSHLALLRRSYPQWTFTEGLADEGDPRVVLT
jgi:hypothetical protein